MSCGNRPAGSLPAGFIRQAEAFQAVSQIILQEVLASVLCLKVSLPDLLLGAANFLLQIAGGQAPRAGPENNDLLDRV